ncbi:MAG: hypothetical protein JO168_16090 [Solirubrobacterales bacterium]|nr:hypothetical protein [Solirubrobacterales bacterium]MBV9717578.1 hypothetical protein [Solirubrobacterales bacterium]
MTGGARRQTWRRTSRELHRSLSADGRRWVREVWGAAEELARQPGLLSPPTTALAARIAERETAAPGREGDDARDAFTGVARIGYAARAVVAAPTEQPSPPPESFAPGPPFELARLSRDPAAAGALVDRLEWIAVHDFASAMTLPQEIWRAFVATATRSLQRSQASEALSWREFGRERIERLLRHGYLLRCLDEAFAGDGAESGASTT